MDALVEGIHFDRAFVPPDAIGHRALAVNLSDLAAMGAAPRLALLSLALPLTFPITDFDALVTGVAASRRTQPRPRRRRQPDAIDRSVDDRHHALRHRQSSAGAQRAGARAGDHLYVSGTIGSAAAGLAMLRMKGSTPTSELSMTEALHQRRTPRTRRTRRLESKWRVWRAQS